MAQKFTSSISEKSREQILAEIKAGKVSNFFKSSCPWTNGQKLTFDKLVLVDWDNGSQSGSYLAAKFKDNDNAFALSMPLKKVFAYKTADDEKKKELCPLCFQKLDKSVEYLVRDGRKYHPDCFYANNPDKRPPVPVRPAPRAPPM